MDDAGPWTGGLFQDVKQDLQDVQAQDTQHCNGHDRSKVKKYCISLLMLGMHEMIAITKPLGSYNMDMPLWSRW